MSVGFGTRAKAAAYTTAIGVITGSDPVVEELSDRIRIRFTKAQSKQMRALVDAKIKSAIKSKLTLKKKLPAGEGGDAGVDLDLGSTFTPLVVKYTFPVALALFIGGILADRYLFHGGHR